MEIESEGRSVLVDAGIGLDEKPGTADRAAFNDWLEQTNVEGVVVSHGHPDHFGRLGGDCPRPVWIGRDAATLLEVAGRYTSIEPPRVDFHLVNSQQFEVGPFRVTPLMVDHSAFEAFTLLIEAGGKRLLYSGDFRGHGRKRGLFAKFLRSPPPSIDSLLMEGTNLGSEDRGPGELNVEASITSQIESAEGIVLVAFSPQNLDRLVTLFKAARRNRRELVVDLYTAEILEALGHHRLPKVGWDGIRVIVPASQRTKAKRESSFRLLNSLGKGRISIDEVSSDPAGFVVMFRKSMCDEFEELAYRDGTELIWSMWGGYLDRDDELRKWLSDRNVSVTKTHASGHATTDDLVRFAGAVSAREVVPIHTTSSHRYQELFENVRVRADGEWWSV